MENAYCQWVIESKTAITHLQCTKLRFLKYEDLAYENYLVNAMESVRHTYERKQIYDWYCFASGERDLTIQDFKEHFLAGINQEEHLLLFTDEGHSKKWLFIILVKEFDIFASWYEDYFNREFYEFSEYVLIFSHLDKVIFNDDEGGINEFVVL
ncbi:hypothetical protein [[Flexibacter] sp. ATCC 35208]|uniref:hypothetical protein n=1 Tax=[Flexibacter] sp. ATCC 35208 TaxID=1936242 RepID=UPI0009C57720|nr:hypothetical protein [[Flexibacter] sp. ATCC 35208]OMP75159.1 hypothetical protein BW716_31665 [[Flexibacter] sp. ATCC 35208]